MRERHECCAIGQDILAGGSDVAGDQHDEASHAGRAIKLAKRVLLLHMADLVSENAGDHVHVAVGQFDEFVGDDECAIGQRKSIGADRAALPKIEIVASDAPGREGRNLVEGLPDLGLPCLRQPGLAEDRLVER